MLREVRCVHCIPANGVRPPPPHSILLDSEWQNHLLLGFSSPDCTNYGIFMVLFCIGGPCRNCTKFESACFFLVFSFINIFFFFFFLAALFLPLLKRIKRTIFTAKDPELNPYRPLADLRSLVSHTFSRLRDALYEALIMRVCSRAIFS